MISSILVQDLYKITMAQAVMEKFPNAVVRYEFFNRDPKRVITPVMLEAIRERVYRSSSSVDKNSITADVVYLHQTCPYLKWPFLDALRNRDIRLVPGQVQIGGGGRITVAGPWCTAILWEVPLLAIISEVCMTHPWAGGTPDHVLEEVSEKTEAKAKILSQAGCKFADFGTRRRFSSLVHDRVVAELVKYDTFIGTSNVYLARKYGLKPIGTMAHEWVQGVSGLVGLRHANRFAMELWNDVYRGDLGIALTDTFGTDAFWGDFDGVLARCFDGVRQDSGDPFVFADRAIEEYHKRHIDPKSKTIIFSDGLDVEKVLNLERVFSGKIKTAYGIGTNLTCDVDDHPPMNIVVKLVEIDGIPVVKLSDSPGKIVGDSAAVNVAKWTFGMGK